MISSADIDALVARLRNAGQDFSALLEEAAAALAALKADAERYRWLRLHVNAPELFDAAIDAALLATEKE